MFDSSSFVGEDIFFHSSKFEEGRNYSLHSIFNLLSMGCTSKEIRKRHPDILPETVTLARSILIARNAEFFPDTQSERIFRDFKVLIDENISPDTAGYLRLHFKRVNHVNDVGLTGHQDARVWEWALNNSYDIIFTKDKANQTERDLTFIAVNDARSILRAMDQRRGNNITLAALPMLVHLSGSHDVEAELKKLLRRNKEEFFNYLDNRATPYLDVRSGSIVCGPTYFELRGRNHIEDHKISEEDFGRAKLNLKERYKLMWLSRLSVEEIRSMNPEREQKVDEQITRMIGMGGGDPQPYYLA